MKRTMLAGLREEIDILDEKIVRLLNERAAIALQVGRAKAHAPVYRPAREAEVLAHVRSLSSGALPDTALTAVYREIIAGCRNVQQPLKVAYLGPAGTYCEAAARTFYGTSSEYSAGATIDEAVSMTEKGTTDVAVIPVENSNEGAVTRTLDLLASTPLVICGEMLLPIHHQLLSSADDLPSITGVIAHPQALAQCRQWLDMHLAGVERRSVSSNGEAARQAVVNKDLAAIAGMHAAKLYDVPIMAHNIEDDSNNTTRFLVLGRTDTASTGNDKTSLVCGAPNRPGALHAILGILATQGVNIIKLESRPSPRALWEYIFYIDIDGHHDDEHISRALDLLQEQTIYLKMLGSYPKG